MFDTIFNAMKLIPWDAVTMTSVNGHVITIKVGNQLNTFEFASAEEADRAFREWLAVGRDRD
jgi:hypothetical protein